MLDRQATQRLLYLGHWVGWSEDQKTILVYAKTLEEAYASGGEKLIYEYLEPLDTSRSARPWQRG